MLDKSMLHELEEKILYSILNYPEKHSMIFLNCVKEIFADSINSAIFGICKELWQNRQPIEPVTICNNLDKIEFVNIATRLVDIQNNGFCVSPLSGFYCRELFENYLNKCYKTIRTENDFLKIKELKERCNFEEQTTNNHISANIDKLINGYSKDNTKAIFSYYNEIDNSIGSFSGGDYIVLGASTSVGKSTFAINIARNVCMQDKTVLYFSLEMPLEQIQNKMICMQNGLSANKYRNFGFDLNEWEIYKKGAKELEQWKLNVICDYSLTPEKMKMYIEKQKEVDFVILDYLGLMSGYSNKSLYEKITNLSRQIKLLATEHNIPIMCLVQLNRDLKNRPDKRPCLFDIRESGAIEQDADIVFLLHREGLYNPEIPKNKLEVIIGKNRHGESNRIIELNYELRTQLIKEEIKL